MKTGVISNDQSVSHFTTQSSSNKKMQSINYGDGYHFQNKTILSAPNQKQVNKSPQKIPMNNNKAMPTLNTNIANKIQQQYNVYESPIKLTQKEKGINKSNSVSIYQYSANQIAQNQSQQKNDGISSLSYINPNGIAQFDKNKVGQTPTFFQNNKSQQISSINSIPNISINNCPWTVSDLGSQVFGINEQIPEKIILICSQILKEDPTNLKVLEKRLKQYIKTGEQENAFQDSEQILKREPRNTFALFSRGNLLMQKGEVEKALNDFEKVLSIDPDNVNAALAKASCLNIKGDYVKAIDQYEDALEKDIEKTSMLNLSINLKRNFKSSNSSQTCYYDRLEKEELQFGSDHKLSHFSPPFIELKKLQSQQQFGSSQPKGGNYQQLLRSQSDQVDKMKNNDQKLVKVKSFAESETQSPLCENDDNRSNQMIPQSAFSKNKQNQQMDEQGSTNNTNSIKSDEKIIIQANFYFGRGYAARQKNEYWKAIELYSQAISLKPDFLKAVFNRGFLFDKLEQFEKACEDYTHAIEIDNKCAFAYFNRGISMNKQREYEKAIQDFTAAINIDNSNSDFYLNRANAYQKIEMHTEAIKDYTFCLDFQVDRLPAVLISRAMSYEKNGENERAKHDYQRALDIGTNQSHICYSRLATIYFYANNLQMALTLYNKALEKDGKSLYCLAKRAQLYIKLELYKLASEDLTKAISINDQIDALFYYRGKAYKYMGKQIESTEDLLTALTLNPNDPNIYRLLSKNMLDLEQYEDSITYTTKEMELVGPSKQSLFNRAFCYNKLNKFQEAENDLRQLLSEDKESIKLLKSLSVCLLNQMKYEEAIKYLDLVINKIDKNDIAEFYKYRSECYFYLNQQDKAAEDEKMYKLTKTKI